MAGRRVLVPCLLFLCFTLTSSQLAPRAFEPLPVGTVTPKGWLLAQLKLQADGLSGHLSQFWNDIQNSVWIGGGGDGGLHERTPYWLNGIVPLAFLLDNAGEDMRPVAKGIYHHKHRHAKELDGPTIMAQAEMYIDYILGHRNLTDGWLGPAVNTKDGNTYWGPSNTMQALYQYAEGVLTRNKPVAGQSPKARAANATDAILHHLLEQKRRMKVMCRDDVTRAAPGSGLRGSRVATCPATSCADPATSDLRFASALRLGDPAHS